MFQLRSWLKYNIKLTSSPFHQLTFPEPSTAS
jgi:hypothetical protein